ncbi:MAG: hypothetical protein ACI9A2_004158, partial [Halioglobus sp.]
RRIVLHGAIIPECDRAWLPLKTTLIFRPTMLGDY